MIVAIFASGSIQQRSCWRAGASKSAPSGLLAFGRAMLEAASGEVAVVKPQVAFFERFGPEGYQVLARIIAEARERGLLVLADAKRGDIGSTMDGYAGAWLGDGAPLRVDVITANAYLGLASLDPLLKRARECGATVFVVLRSSNPESTLLQLHGEPPLWRVLLDEMREWAGRNGGQTMGAVVGATMLGALEETLACLPEGLILAPGIGTQGAAMSDLSTLPGGARRVLASASRGIAEKGPDIAALKRQIVRTRNS